MTDSDNDHSYYEGGEKEEEKHEEITFAVGPFNSDDEVSEEIMTGICYDKKSCLG
jgi:hypothetical protein